MVSSFDSNLDVLLVEDDCAIATAVCEGLARKGIRVHHASTVADGKRRLMESDGFDAIILDLTLPDGDGATIADACRQHDNDTPIIMVTAKDNVEDRIAGLRRGADDYIGKPFAVEELIARLEAVLRRTRPANRHILIYHDVELDLVKRRVRRGDIDTSLSAREMDLLAYLMSHPEEVLSKRRILDAVWGEGSAQNSNVLHVYANYLRNKLEAGRYPRIIHTVRSVGYVLTNTDPEATPPTRQNDQPDLIDQRRPPP